MSSDAAPTQRRTDPETLQTQGREQRREQRRQRRRGAATFPAPLSRGRNVPRPQQHPASPHNKAAILLAHLAAESCHEPLIAQLTRIEQ